MPVTTAALGPIGDAQRRYDEEAKRRILQTQLNAAQGMGNSLNTSFGNALLNTPNWYPPNGGGGGGVAGPQWAAVAPNSNAQVYSTLGNPQQFQPIMSQPHGYGAHINLGGEHHVGATLIISEGPNIISLVKVARDQWMIGGVAVPVAEVEEPEESAEDIIRKAFEEAKARKKEAA